MPSITDRVWRAIITSLSVATTRTSMALFGAPMHGKLAWLAASSM